jgi:tRNA(Ile)-lysidine synthase
MKNLLEHVEQSIRQRKLFRPGEKILVAVSGGLDSMVLLHLLHKLAAQFGWKLFAAHFNHQLRGRASDADERFVRKTADALDLPFKAGRGAVKALAKKRGLSIEMAARELRHEFLAQTAARWKCRVVAVAHHADDQVELFFLRLLRGAGSDGLAGMKWHSVSPANKRVRIARPLLDVTKEALEQFTRENGVRFREDASNASRDFLRNRVRHELLPLLRRRFQPAVDRAILRLMEIVGADADIANEAASGWFKLESSKRRFAEQPVGIQRRIIQFQLRELEINADFELIESLRSLPGRVMTVHPGLCVRCDAVGNISRVSAKNRGFQCMQADVELRGKSGLLEFDRTKIRWLRGTCRGNSLGHRVPNREIFDADRVGTHIILRHWRAGDRFQPIGMAAAVKLQDWFTNRKISRERRRELIVATTAQGKIFWVEGERIGEQSKLTTATRRRLIWRWKRG